MFNMTQLHHDELVDDDNDNVGETESFVDEEC